MTDEQNSRLDRLHRTAFIVDAHFDLPLDVSYRRERGETKVIETRYLDGFKRGGVDLIMSAVFIHDYFLPEMGLHRALSQISHLYDEIEETPGKFRICRTTAEAFTAKEDGDIALMLSLEGADPLHNDLGLLRIFYELGVRGVGLVWSRRNYAADGAFFAPLKEGRKGGLTPFGVKLVERAEQLGMIIDLSHINDEGFRDVMGIVTRPIVVSHSNCRSLAASMRNLTDEQIEAVAANGGVIGINSVNMFTDPKKEKAGATDLVNHVDHIVRIAGIEHVGIGFDICNGFTDFLQLEEALPAYDIIKDHSRLPEFTAALSERGYTDAGIIAILGENFLRVYKEILG